MLFAGCGVIMSWTDNNKLVLIFDSMCLYSSA